MSDDRRKIVERYTGRPNPSPIPESETRQDEGGDAYQPAAPVSANRPPELMLELRFKRGDSLGLSYALLISAAFNPSEGISLEFTTHRVAIAGRNLKGVYRALVSHRLAYLQELAAPLDDQPHEAVVITALNVTAL